MLKRRTDFGSQEGDRLRLSDEDWLRRNGLLPTTRN
jgi:hypothetical protein